MLSDYTPTEFDDMLGPWLTTGPNAIEPGDIPPGRGIVAQNVEYRPGQVRTRYGFSPVTLLANLGDSFQAMEGWLSPYIGGAISAPVEKEYLAYLATPTSPHPGFNVVDTTTGMVQNLWTPSLALAASAVFSASSNRLYMTPVTANGDGADAPRVFSNATISLDGGLDQLFQGPVPATITAVDGGPTAALGITVGKHNIGFLMQTRNGYTTAPGPIDPSTGLFAPFTATVTVAGDSLLVNITATWPASVVSVFPIITTADNLAQYYISPEYPDGQGVVGGTTSTVGFTLYTDDGTLAATALDATPYFGLFSGVLRLSYLGEYSNRMVYIGVDADGIPTIFVSDLQNFQAISLARSVIYLSGDRLAICAFNLYGNLYIVGPHWTYQTIDNAGDPVTWAPPQLIDGQIGTLSPNGVTVNSAQGLAWVADVDGLYLFAGGSYQSRPVSYYQKSDWIRINWSVAAVVRVVDSKDTQRVHVLVPLDGALTPTHVMTWDYTRGLTPETVNYSLDTYGSFAPGAIAIVENDIDKHIEVWLGPTNASQPVVHQNNGTEGNPYQDNGQPITSIYQTGLMPRLTENVLHHIGDHLRLTGNGTCKVSASTLDGGRTVPLTDVTLGPSPAQAILRRYHLLSEAATLTFKTLALDAYFVLSAIVHYSKELVSFR